MGTFHADKGDLHGITVVVATHGERIYIGRCDEEKSDGIQLLDVDFHDEGTSERTRAEYLDRAQKFGIFAKEKRLFVPRADIAEVRRLG